tara:strand:- start:600 stop:3818 length:3219 start_codon:yes stop_codon:yes gene_type:complete
MSTIYKDMSFNIKARESGYQGNAINKKGDISLRYKKFLKEKEGNAPIPKDQLYNNDTNRLVNKTAYLTKGRLKKKYAKKGYVLFRQTIDKIKVGKFNKSNLINKFIRPDSWDPNKSYLDVGKWWIDILNTLPINGKKIRITLDCEFGIYDVWEGVLTRKYPRPLRDLVVKYYEGIQLYYPMFVGFDGIDYPDDLDLIGNQGGNINVVMYDEVKPIKLKQRYLLGLDYHCVLNPIIDYYKNLLENAQSAGTIKKYQATINKLQGSLYKNGKVRVQGLLDKYKEGLYIEDLEELVETLNIGIKILSPFTLYDNNKVPIYEFRPKGFNKNPEKIFHYVNSRSNHLDNIICENVETIILPIDEMKDKLEEIWDEGFYPYKKTRDEVICKIYTGPVNYELKNDSRDIVQEFEKRNNLTNNKIYTDSNYNQFILDGVHYNSCVDFDTRPDYTLATNDFYHIDMEKAYFNFKMNPLYDKDQAFLCRCSYYSNQVPKEYAIKNVGYYRINKINLSAVNKNTRRILEKLNVYQDGLVYPHIDLKYLDSIGANFLVLEGVYGLNMELDFGEDMKRKFMNGEESNKGIALYSSWVGLQNSISTESKMYVKKDKEFLQAVKGDLSSIGKDTKVFINSSLVECLISYPKGVSGHRSHITGYITAYQRTATLIQLEQFKYDNLMRVVVDGIYFKNEVVEKKGMYIEELGTTIYPPEKIIKEVVNIKKWITCSLEEAEKEFIQDSNIKLISSFKWKPQNYKSNHGGDVYISNDYKYRKELIKDNKITFMPAMKAVLYSGAGGTGKTWVNLNMGNKLGLRYMGHSNKLCRAIKAEYPNLKVNPYQWLLLKNYELEKVANNANFILIDEASTLTSNMIDSIIKKTEGIPLVFMGDITHQCLPIVNNDDEYKYNLEQIKGKFDLIIDLGKDGKIRRFKDCDKQLGVAREVRDMMDKKYSTYDIKEYCKNQYGVINEDDLMKEIRIKDIVLSSTHNNKDSLTEKISKVLEPKYFIKKTTGGYYASDVVYEKPKISDKAYIIQYCYTIHSVQGETVEDNQNLYIDSRNLYNSRVLYTAISRAKYARQIKFII